MQPCLRVLTSNAICVGESFVHVPLCQLQMSSVMVPNTAVHRATVLPCMAKRGLPDRFILIHLHRRSVSATTMLRTFHLFRFEICSQCGAELLSGSVGRDGESLLR
jgi:hypothetical protein